MEKDIMNVRRKHPYDVPTLMVVSIASAKLFAASGDPEVHTSTEKASTDYDALVKDKSTNVWDEEW